MGKACSMQNMHTKYWLGKLRDTLEDDIKRDMDHTDVNRTEL
jgi:hypothetical protein